MIKFFRKIRLELINKNMNTKYFKYAIGEIILVVIGILIALQINNWNDYKKSKEKEKQILTEIISDLDYSLKEFDRVTNNRTNNLKRTIYSIKTLINVIESNQSYKDSLGYYFRAANAYDMVDFKTSGYQSLISIGTDLIEEPSIRSGIGQFYTSTISNIKGDFEEVHLDFYSYMIDYFRKDFTMVLDNTHIETLVPNNFEALKKDKEYVQSLRTFLSVNDNYLNQLKIANQSAKELKDNIENYIR
jgi:hypothetical protein